MRFENDFPQNVRVYHIDYSDFLPKIKFDGILYQESNSPCERTYVDEAIIKSRHYQKIYIFEREQGKPKSNSLRSWLPDKLAALERLCPPYPFAYIRTIHKPDCDFLALHIDYSNLPHNKNIKQNIRIVATFQQETL